MENEQFLIEQTWGSTQEHMKKDILDEDIIIEIKNMLDKHNQYAQKFRMTRDKLQSSKTRFLLAAKAMTSESPPYASKKAHIGQEQQKQKKKEVNTESSCPINQHRPKALPHYTQDIDGEESDNCSEYANYTTTTWGLFPRFCLLNPMPGLRIVDKVQ
ncbi:hypothetical protein JHK82_034988 [Glycine max]|nr:hypothetical protein JHK82_034988 [Glycine max]